MSESVQRLRANRPLQGRPCGWCGVPLDFGDPAAVCTACSTATHAVCWDSKGGCPTADCVNRPLARLEQPAGAAALAEVQGGFAVPAGAPAGAGAPAETLYEPGAGLALEKKQCPHCGFQIPADSTLCSYCNMVTTADGIYRGPKTNAPGAVASLVNGIVAFFVYAVGSMILGILAFFFCGGFGLSAINKANNAKKAIAADPRLGGDGLASAGRILGILALVLWGMILLIRLADLAS